MLLCSNVRVELTFRPRKVLIATCTCARRFRRKRTKLSTGWLHLGIVFFYFVIQDLYDKYFCIPICYSTSNLSGMNDDSVDVGTLVDFKLPVLLLERCKDPSKEALPSTLPTSGPRRSSMRISGKRKRTPLKVHDSSIDSCEENSDGANYSHSESEVDDKFESSFSRCKVPVKRFRRKFSDFSNTSQQIADRLYKYKCTKCPTKFKMQKEYHWHMLNIHGDGSKNSEILTCPLCGRYIFLSLLLK